MDYFQVPSVLVNVFNEDSAEVALSNLLPILGELLQCNRVFLYLRHPPSRIGRTPFCWRQSATIPEIYDAQWSLENPEQLEQQDPLFAAALEGEPSIYIEDVEEAEPAVLNREFELQQFGHRALVHAHLYHNNQLWGILQPCMFGHPRTWTTFDRTLIDYAAAQSELLAVSYVMAHQPLRSIPRST